VNPGPLHRRRRSTLIPSLAWLFAVLPLVLLPLVLAGCSGRDLPTLPLATAEADPVIFADAFGSTLDYSAFADSYYEALSIDETVARTGSASLKVEVPGGSWAGGAFWTHSPRDLSGYNALTFYARSSTPLTLNSCGIGLDVNSDSPYQAEIANVALTDQEWTLVVIPIPNPARLTSERGMFWYSEAEGSETVDIWFDDVQYAVVGVTNPRPVMTSTTAQALLGETVPIQGTRTTFSVDGVDVVVAHKPFYFDYFSSDEAVATAADGVVTVVGGGEATITAKLVDVDVSGQLTLQIPPPPTGPAPTPTQPAGDVISIFSDAYAVNVPVDTWLATWSNASGVYDRQIDGDNVKVYTGLDTAYKYASVDFASNPIDAASAGMTYFHMDVWAPTGTLFYFELIDFGANGVYGGGDDTAKKVLFHALTTPSFAAAQWSSLDIPLTQFTGMNFGAVAQFNLQTGDGNTIYLDNVYFHK